jgi:tRNA(Ile)-lysidine synthase
VSGGADSTALAILAVRAGLQPVLWHVDHGLRDGGADEAAAVVRLAGSLGATAECRRVQVAHGPNLEARARAARYAVLPDGVLTGHTLDDQAETVLINLLRGAGVTGLTGIKRPSTRPLLGLRRSEARALCVALGVTVLDDPMNADARFLRTRVRTEVLPLLDDVSGRDVAAVLARQAALMRDDDDLLDELAVFIDPTDAVAVRSAPVALARRAIRAWLADPYPPDAACVERVLEVARGERAACDVGGSREVRRSKNRLTVA